MTAAKHILQIAPTPFFADRGCHIRIEGIVRSLTELGYQNTVCTYHHGRDVDGVHTVRISPIENYTQTAAGPSKYKLWADWKLLWTAFGQYRRLKPVSIHAHLHEGLLIGLLLKLMFFWRGTPLIGDMQGSLTGELDAHGAVARKSLLHFPLRWLERFLMWSATHIVCSSPGSLALIQQEFNVPNDKISLAQDGADAAQPLSEQERSSIRSELALPENHTIAVYSGALLDSKGLAQLKALIRATADEPSLHFLIIGYPEENLTGFLLEHELQSRCTLTGQIDFARLGRFLGIADIAIDPKNADAGEGSGKMLNYLAHGLPVIAFATTNNQDFLPDAAPLANNEAELAELLISLHRDATRRRQQGAENLALFESGFAWTTTRAQLQTVYCAHVDRPIPRPSLDK